MRIEPRLDEVVNGKRGILRGIDIALEAECLVSAVSLIFVAIDSLAALARPIGQVSTTRADFLNWSERYLRPTEAFGCASLDLYAARCGVLHTHSPESGLAHRGESRRLVYEWRNGPSADTIIPLPENAVVIHVEALHETFGEATRLFLIDSVMDREVRERVESRLTTLLCYAPWPRLEAGIAA